MKDLSSYWSTADMMSSSLQDWFSVEEQIIIKGTYFTGLTSSGCGVAACLHIVDDCGTVVAGRDGARVFV